jgi:hypothetical protein
MNNESERLRSARGVFLGVAVGAALWVAAVVLVAALAGCAGGCVGGGDGSFIDPGQFAPPAWEQNQ